MDNLERFNFLLKHNNWLVKSIFWLIAGLLLFFLFTNNSYDLSIRIVLVSILILMSIAASYFINNFLIYRYLFKGKVVKFIYFLIYTIVISFWINLLSLFIILVYTGFYRPMVLIPQPSEILILLSGNYLIILLSAIFHFIKESYKRLVEKNNLEKQKQLTEIKLKEANLKLLQGQIHPHFLFNMLNNLYGLVDVSVDNSRAVIMKLSELLDYMLYECDKPFIDIEKEIKFIENYIELERIRHDENFNVALNYPKLNEIFIAPLILFPFVENAFKHGFNEPEKSFIDINVKQTGDNLRFEITNSLVEQKTDKYLKQEGKGIGLRNIKERLDLIYKDKYELNTYENIDEYKVILNLKLDESSE